MSAHPDDCGCCAGVDVETPAGISNAPGLDAIAYRTGTWSAFRESVVARLSSSDLPALGGLRARDDDDLTMALVDGFAVMADVLTFYQERIANEAFLRTATERRSVLELARLLGYTLAPGVAAETWLAFTLQEPQAPAAEAPPPVTIPAGTGVQSVPGPDESAQTFETVADVQAHVRHNALRAQTRARQEIELGLRELYLAGTEHRLATGDAILVVGAERERFVTGENWDVRLLESVEVDRDGGHTRIAWTHGLGQAAPRVVDPATDQVKVFVFRRRAALFGHNAPDPRLLSTNGTNLSAIADTSAGTWNNFEIEDRRVDLGQAYEKIVPGSWVALADATIDHRPESELGYVELYRAAAVTHRSRSDFGLSSRTTRIDLDTGEHLGWYGLRTTLVLAESEELPLAERPVRSPVYGDRLALATLEEALVPDGALAVTGARQHVRLADDAKGLELTLEDTTEVDLAPGDRLALVAAPTRTVAGTVEALEPDELLAAIDERDPAKLDWSVLDRDGRAGTLVAGADELWLDAATEDDEVVAEVAFVADAADGVEHDRDRTHLRLAAALRNVFDRTTVVVNANVAPATHGERVSEILGSGDASRPNQRFTLKQAPLTHVRADTPSGRSSTVELRASDELWTEKATLYGAGANERAYAAETHDDGSTTVTAGDGVRGERLPTGSHNVRASYRKGLGVAGNVRAGQLSTLLARPLGVNEVTNPEPASGGDDPETLDAARQNAPLTVLTLDRAVSLRDYEDFARGFAGIAKAQATWIATGPARGVFLTVAGTAGAAVEPSGPTHAGLVQALRSYGDALVQTTIASYDPVGFRLSATVKLADDAERAPTLDAVRAALLEAFAFDARDFGQTVSLDEVVAVVHRVAGVVAVDVDKLRRSDQSASPPVRPRLFAAMPVLSGATVAPAELLTIDPAALEIGVMP